jgi:type 1 fimbria pilin
MHISHEKKTIIALAVIHLVLVVTLCFFIAINRACAGPLVGVNIKLSGRIVNLACTIEPLDVDKTINLGDWATKQLHYPGGYTRSMPFSIHLTQCTGSGISVTFNGTKYSGDDTLLALNEQSTASGVAVEIMDKDSKRIPIGETSSRFTVDSNGEAVLNFLARFVTVSEPTAGTAYADSEFIITYD